MQVGPYHVLLVDDNEDYRFLASSELARLRTDPSFDVQEAEDAEAALRRIADLAHGGGHLLVLCDHRMPLMDGRGLLRAVRERHPETDIRFVLCSSGDDRHAEDDPAHGADDYFVKPLDTWTFRTALGRQIEKWLGPRRPSREAPQIAADDETPLGPLADASGPPPT